MELWIRSQDKRCLMKVKEITLINDCLCSNDVQITHIETDKGEMGSYLPERALEVLDEIQNILQPERLLIQSQHIDYDNKEEGLVGITVYKEDNSKIQQLDTIVYEMPKE